MTYSGCVMTFEEWFPLLGIYAPEPCGGLHPMWWFTNLSYTISAFLMLNQMIFCLSLFIFISGVCLLLFTRMKCCLRLFVVVCKYVLL